jgi:peroxiredoxin
MKRSILLIFLSLLILSIYAQEKPEGLYINSKAPDFRANDQNGVEVRLKNIIKDSLVVLVFYRGQWCPYCSKHLKKLEDSLLQIREKGARLIAISPEKPANIDKTVKKTSASYSILYDKDMKIMKAFDVAFEVDEKTVSRYKNANIDLLEANGQKDKAYLPVPALYIINKEGTIRYRFFEPDYKKRVSVLEILEHL